MTIVATPPPLDSAHTPRWLVPLCRAAAYLVAALVLLPWLYHVVRGTDGYLVLLTDDFYYYGMVADNLVRSGHMTFDGLTRTNGFHPLFMGVLMGLDVICGGLTPPFYLLLGLFSLGSAVLSFELLLRLGRQLFPQSLLVAPLSALLTLEAARMASWGMETTLAVPLHIGLLLALSRTRHATLRRAAWIGLLSALLILARLDSAMLVGMMAGAWLLLGPAPPRDKVAATVGFSLGGLPFPIYLVANLIGFHGLMPVSAQSKQLSSGMLFNAHLVGDLAGQPLGALALLLAPVGLALLARQWRRTRALDARALVLALSLGFPVVFYLIYGLRSDWYLFQWYYYPLLPAVFVAALQLEEAFPLSPRVLVPAGAGLCLLALLAAAAPLPRRTVGWRPEGIALYHHARQLAEFARSHPGTYAMGDRAGLTAYLLKQPVVQLEGLIADRRMVQHIQAEDPLDAVLREYGVDYLIVSVYRPLQRQAGCYQVQQPNPGQAGTHSRHMSGSFCSEPALLLQSPRGNLPGTAYTYVFSVKH